MYGKLWNKINATEWPRKKKHACFIVLNIILFALYGLVLWLVIKNHLKTEQILWLICCVGYPAVLFGLYGSVFYLFKKDQVEDDGKPESVLEEWEYTEKRTCDKVTAEKRSRYAGKNQKTSRLSEGK